MPPILPSSWFRPPEPESEAAELPAPALRNLDVLSWRYESLVGAGFPADIAIALAPA